MAGDASATLRSSSETLSTGEAERPRCANQEGQAPVTKRFRRIAARQPSFESYFNFPKTRGGRRPASWDFWRRALPRTKPVPGLARAQGCFRYPELAATCRGGNLLQALASGVLESPSGPRLAPFGGFASLNRRRESHATF